MKANSSNLAPLLRGEVVLQPTIYENRWRVTTVNNGRSFRQWPDALIGEVASTGKRRVWRQWWLGRVAYAANKIGEARVPTETLEFRPAPHVKEGGGLRLVGLFQPSQSLVFFAKSKIQVIESSVPAGLDVFVFGFYLFHPA